MTEKKKSCMIKGGLFALFLFAAFFLLAIMSGEGNTLVSLPHLYFIFSPGIMFLKLLSYALPEIVGNERFYMLLDFISIVISILFYFLVGMIIGWIYWRIKYRRDLKKKTSKKSKKK